MNKFSLRKSSKELFSLKAEFIRFASSTEADKIHLGDFDQLKTDPETYLINSEEQSKGTGLPEGWVPHARFWYISERVKHFLEKGCSTCMKNSFDKSDDLILQLENNH